jgi:hypothetical protein
MVRTNRSVTTNPHNPLGAINFKGDSCDIVMSPDEDLLFLPNVPGVPRAFRALAQPAGSVYLCCSNSVIFPKHEAIKQ